MRFLGSSLIFLCITLAGLLHKLKLDHSLKQWQQMQQLLQLVAEELQDSLRSCEEILVSLQDSFSDFLFLQDYFRQDGSVQQRLRAAAQTLTDPKLREIALRFAARFGTASLEIQLESIHRLEQLCAAELQRRWEQTEKSGTLSLQLGLLCGAAAAILLL